MSLRPRPSPKRAVPLPAGRSVSDLATLASAAPTVACAVRGRGLHAATEGRGGPHGHAATRGTRQRLAVLPEVVAQDELRAGLLVMVGRSTMLQENFCAITTLHRHRMERLEQPSNCSHARPFLPMKVLLALAASVPTRSAGEPVAAEPKEPRAGEASRC